MKFWRAFILGLGFLFLGYLVGQIGVDAVAHRLSAVGWAFPLLLAPSLIWHVSNTIAWGHAFPAGPFRPRRRLLFMAKLAGEAINQLTPLANLGGEPLKAYLLRHKTPGPQGLASVIVDKTAQLIVGLTFTVIGLALLLVYQRNAIVLPLRYLTGFAAVLVVSGLGLWWFIRRQDRLFTTLLDFLRRAGLKTSWVERCAGRAERVDASVGYFYARCPGRFWLVVLFQGVGWLMGSFETYLILRIVGAEIDFVVCFLLTSLATIINTLFFFMPSSLGVMEGSQVFLFTSLGLDPALGLSLGIMKRIRRLLWVGVGWVFLTHLGRASATRSPAGAPISSALSLGTAAE